MRFLDNILYKTIIFYVIVNRRFTLESVCKINSLIGYYNVNRRFITNNCYQRVMGG